MSYAVMPMDDYKAACDKVREKTNTTEVIKSGDMVGKMDEVYKAGQLSVFSSSENLKGKAEGNPVTITDISPIEHNVGVSVKSAPLDIQGGKNLEQTDFGYYKSLPFVLEKGKTYTVEVVIPHVGDNDYYQCGCITKSNWANDSSPDYLIEASVNVITPTETAEYCVFLSDHISPAANSQISVSEEGQGGVEGVKVTVCGKNLFNKAEIVDKFNAGEYETSDDTNSYSVVGFQLKPNTKYMVKICGVQNGSMTFINYRKKINSTSGISVSTNWSWTEKVMTTDETGKMYVGTYGATNIQKIGEVLDIALVQVEEGTVATEYEEYREQTYISNADGIVEGVKNIYPSMSISAEDSITISAEYYKDIDKVLENLAINIALSGGN